MASWVIFTYIAVLVLESQGLLICLISSSATPMGLTEELANRLDQTFSQFSVLKRVSKANSKLELGNDLIAGCDLAVDVTADEHVSTLLGVLCKEENVGLMSLSSAHDFKSSNSFSAKQRDQSGYLDSIFRHFRWTSVSLLYSPTTQGH